MAELNQSLKDYLSRSANGASNNIETPNSGKGFGLSSLNFFKKTQQSGPDDIGDASPNGWFSQAQNDPCFPSLSRKQRILGFVVCLLLGTFCFSVASLYIPLLLLKARKFAVLYSLGSLFVISSFSFLWGPTNHVKHLFSIQRLPFTTAYFGTMLATLYFSLWLRSTMLTVFFAIAQIITLVWYVVSYIPGGKTGLKFFSSLFYSAASKTVQKTLPV